MANPIANEPVVELTPQMTMLVFDPSIPANDQIQKSAVVGAQSGARFAEALDLAIGTGWRTGTDTVTPPPTTAATGSASLNVATIFGPTAANGATAYSAEVGGVPVKGWAFSSTVDQGITASFLMPYAWDGGPLTFQLGWKHLATTINFGVAFEISAACLADGANLSAVFGPPVIVSDTGGDDQKTYTTAQSAVVIVGGTPAGGNKLVLKIIRRTTDSADTLAVEAEITGLLMLFSTGPQVSGSGVFPFTFPFILG